MRRVQSILIGIFVSVLGLLLAGQTMSGTLCLAGIGVFAIGEMLASPKINEYLGVIAPEGQKGLYMGYANMPTAIGWAYGSRLGGDLYDRFGDKANLAVHYLQEHYHLAGVDHTGAVARLQEVAHVDASQATILLWNAYQPWRVWWVFGAIGVAAGIGIFFYARWARKFEAADV